MEATNWLFFTSGPIKSDDLQTIIIDTIVSVEQEGFNVLGITSDQGANFEKCFKDMGVTYENPEMIIGNKTYFIHKDPPHLLKNARNVLLNHYVYLEEGQASWKDITTFYEKNRNNSLILAPKLTENHLYNLKFRNKMKVKYASQVMSSTVACALNFYIEQKLLPPSAAGTSSYVKKINDSFDILNSLTMKDKIKLRKPIDLSSETIIEELNHYISWFQKLSSLNKSIRVKFIKGFIQSLKVIQGLISKLKTYNLKYFSTRNLCQDPLENLFGQIRYKQRNPTPMQFNLHFKEISLNFLAKSSKYGRNTEDDSFDSQLIDFNCWSQVVS